jgi:phenylpropionate dioxygenase-like ring-hydroxylating dioxygenase large terminal subunit
MDTIVASTERQSVNLDGPGYHQSWYPVCLARDIDGEALTGIDILGTRVIVYRDAAGKAVVQSAWCPHLGADLSQGKRVDGTIQCPYHHWRFAASGACTHIPTGDRIPPAARIFTYMSVEAWGLIWAFNGKMPLFDPPRIPGIEESALSIETHFRGARTAPPEVATSNGIDFQHLRTLHGLQTTEPDTLTVRAHDIEYRVETEYYLQHGMITGTNVFAQHLRVMGRDMYMLFCSAPIDKGHRRSFFVIGTKQDGAPAEQQATLTGMRDLVERLLGEDEPVLDGMRFRRGVLVASDRHLARYFRYVSEFPRAEPPGA